MNNEFATQYLDAGKKLMPLVKGIPIHENWVNRDFNINDIEHHKGSIGWVLSESDLVIDVDPRNFNDGDSFKKLLKNNPSLKLTPTVNTPRGGFHIYLTIPKEYRGGKFKKTLHKEYPGIDFLTKGCCCDIAGCKNKYGQHTWKDDLFCEFEQYPAPEIIIKLIHYTINNDNDDGLGDFSGLIGGNSSSWPEDKVNEMLLKLDPSMPNDEWVKVGMALHDWDTINGLELWEEWSKEGDNYTEGDTETRWRSFDLGGGVTLGTISYMVKEVDFDDILIRINKYINDIKNANEKTLEFDIIPKLKDEDFSRLNKEKLVKAVQDRYKDITGVRMPVSNIRNMLSKVDIVNGMFIEDTTQPEWCKDWIYVNSHSGFINLKTLKVHKSESFNIGNGKYIPTNDIGTKPSATKYVADKGFVDKVDSIAYLPTYDDIICTINGSTILNSFNPKTVPIEAEEYTDSGLEAIKKIETHIKLICGNEKDSYTLTQWLAHQIQYPGKQILWSPVIQSIQGMGKSFFGELLRSSLGDRNVGTVSPTQVTSDFNGWATDVAVNVLEELRVKGHNRYDTVNALKPLVTDRMIQINDKGVKQYMTYNTTNYICFTNYKDAIPIDHDDRRWWIIFVPIESLNELPAIIGENYVIYFHKLFDAVRNNGPEIRKWFLEYEITNEFMSTKQAPMTSYKLSMIATEECNFEGLSEIKELIETGNKYYNNECISSSDLFEHLIFEYPEIQVNTRARHILLKKLGYMSIPKPIKIDGKARRIWTKRPMTNSEIRLKFDGKNLSIENFS